MVEASSSSRALKSSSLGRRRARRRSLPRLIRIATITSSNIGPASNSKLIGSPVGVATAAKMKTIKMIHRHQETKRAPDKTPAKLSSTIISGARKPTPNTRIVRIKNERYRSTETIFSTPAGVNPKRICMPYGRTVYASITPPAKSGVAAATNPKAQNFSFRRRPGVTKRHSW